MKEEKDIQELLKGHFEAFEAEPDRDLWSGIQAGLRGEGSPRRRVFPLWARYAAVAASLLLLFGVIWLLNEGETAPQAPLAQEEPAPSQATPAPLAEADQEVAPMPPDEEAGPTDPDSDQGGPSNRPRVQRAVAQQSAASPDSDASAEPAPQEPRRDPRMANSQIGVTTPLHRQWAIRQQMETSLEARDDAVALEQVKATKLKGADSSQEKSQRGTKNQLDLNQLTFASAVSFASEELSKLAQSPVEIYTERTPEKEVRTYEFDLLNLKITRKVHRQKKN